ncbi:hypothetical protein GF352_02795 [archaeon]|nr:hypothetical protein [archaeon]
MNLLGVTLREIHLVREDLSGSEVQLKNVQNNVNITDINLRGISPNSSDKALVFSFEYKTDYDLSKPKGKSLGKIHFLGEVAFSDKKKAMDKVLKSWKKDKKIDDDVLFPVLQAALNFVNIEAIYLARKVLLPSPIRLPQVKPQKSD